MRFFNKFSGALGVWKKKNLLGLLNLLRRTVGVPERGNVHREIRLAVKSVMDSAENAREPDRQPKKRSHGEPREKTLSAFHVLGLESALVKNEKSGQVGTISPLNKRELLLRLQRSSQIWGRLFGNETGKLYKTYRSKKPSGLFRMCVYWIVTPLLSWGVLEKQHLG